LLLLLVASVELSPRNSIACTMNSHEISKTWDSEDGAPPPHLLPLMDDDETSRNAARNGTQQQSTTTLFPRWKLIEIVEDKVRGTNKSGINKLDMFKAINTATTDIPKHAFVHTVDNKDYALWRSNKFEIAEEDVQSTATCLFESNIGDWYDAQKIKEAKQSIVKFFSYWFTSRYSPTAALVEFKLIEAGFTPSKVKELVNNHRKSQCEQEFESDNSAVLQSIQHNQNAAVVPSNSTNTNDDELPSKELGDIDVLALRMALKTTLQENSTLQSLLDAPFSLADEQKQHAATRSKLEKAMFLHEHTGKADFYAPPPGPTEKELEAAAAQALDAASAAQSADRSVPWETRLVLADAALAAEVNSHKLTKLKLEAVNQSIDFTILQEC